MNFRQYCIPILLLLFHPPIYMGAGRSYAQFTGGSADGHSLVSKTDVAVCALPGYSNVSIGGNSDGYALVSKTDVVSCTLPGYSNIGIGGSSDGYALVSKTDVASCTLPEYSNVSIGGNSDGYALVSKTDVTVCTLLEYSNVSIGGSSDGHALVSKTDVASCTLPEYFNVSIGGSSDGYALVGPSGCLSVLPIELISFTATLTDNKTVFCEWVTASEINNDYFTIEKTKDGINYEIVGNIKGSNNSTVILHYSMIDDFPYSGLSYYRLKQTDFDGKFRYSQLEAINLEGIELISIYPNPASTDFEYLISSVEDGKVEVLVLDVQGRRVIEKAERINKGLCKKNINVSSLSSGSYLLQIVTHSKKTTQKQFLK